MRNTSGYVVHCRNGWPFLNGVHPRAIRFDASLSGAARYETREAAEGDALLVKALFPGYDLVVLTWPEAIQAEALWKTLYGKEPSHVYRVQ